MTLKTANGREFPRIFSRNIFSFLFSSFAPIRVHSRLKIFILALLFAVPAFAQEEKPERGSIIEDRAALFL